MSLTQYGRFLVIGAFVGLITVGCRELIGHMLVVDSAAYYSLSVVLAYMLGIVLSYVINRRHTFNQHNTAASLSNLALFGLIALLGASCTWLLSMLLRYGVHLTALLGHFAAPVAFAFASLLATLITYPLNARFVFRRDR
jgi:putative flippase GtrA